MKKLRILVIDDNHAIHDDFRKILSPATTTGALDVTEAELFGKPVPHGGMVQQLHKSMGDRSARMLAELTKPER